ncbi:MAG: ceramidase domain-containing protein [Zoogloeaceae bacterium]|uniref:ceramidase domain-containing protein n=1 Tax=Denitromonas sp. TaxID=2734609 RepID=UPI001D866A48|nr:ceramidase domain-containing protein [Rhodocyclaceae bacterium]MCP5222362.1 ceramidase domain-containing protein [Zoogloeaceae bacterium]HPR05246.1 ceramidase domain-containing protein [Denitromonas sp.]
MNWRAPLDVYCERTDAGLWAEPVNALTNLAFLLVAVWLLRRMDRRTPADLRVLAGLIGAVGVGSGVFHTVAQTWAAVLDVVFIAIFVMVFLQRALVRLIGWRSMAANVAVLGMLVASAGIALSVKLPALNGSELYLGPWLALIALAVICPTPCARRWLIAAATLFGVSMLCRSIDLLVCDAFPLGTHFGWHVNNALVLYCGMRALMTAPARRLPC